MNIWIISGPNLPDVRVKAESFDDAMKAAREIDSDYTGGHVKEDYE